MPSGTKKLVFGDYLGSTQTEPNQSLYTVYMAGPWKCEIIKKNQINVFFLRRKKLIRELIPQLCHIVA